MTTPDRFGWLKIAPCLGLAATLLMKIQGADIWWHLRTGQWILAQQAVPTVDPFSHTAAGPWRYTEALAQVVLASIHKLAGEPGLVLFHVLLGLLLATILVAYIRNSAGPTALVIALWGAGSLAALALKPQMFSYLAFATLLWLLRDLGEGRHRRLYWIPPLFLLWGNLHRGGTLGLFILVLVTLVWFCDPERRQLARKLAVVSLISAGCLLLNPGGSFYLTSALDLATRSSFRELLQDWRPLTFDVLWSKHLPLLILAVAWVAGRLWRRRRLDTELWIVLATTVLATRSVRFVPFAGLALAPGVARLVGHLVTRWSGVAKASARALAVQVVLVLVGLGILAGNYLHHVPPTYRGVTALEFRMPVALAAFLEQHPPPGNMLNRFNFGGYLLYALAPEQKVFIDGRNDTVYDEEFSAPPYESPSIRSYSPVWSSSTTSATS